MESSFHCHDILIAEFSEYQSSGMAFDCGYGEIRDVFIGEFVAVSYLGR